MTMTSVDLRAEAIAETLRLTRARALLRDGDEPALSRLEGDATWIARSRRNGLRRSLRGRACLLWRVAFEEESGRLVESTLVPVLVEMPRGADGRSTVWIRFLVEQADGLVRARVDAECEAWRAEVKRVASAFSSAQERREREIELAGQTDCGQPVAQPGLFDRRADRSRQAHASASAEAERFAAGRRRAIHASAQIAPRPARLLLVLVS